MMQPRRAVLVAAAFALLGRSAAAVQSEDSDDQSLLADADYTAGRAALKGGDAAVAVQRFTLALKRFPDAADLHNELGFSHRKLAQMERAFFHYQRALALKPDHRGAHEYIGEAYLMVDDVAGAERHRAALRALCVVPCDELKDLDQAIAQYEANKAKPAARKP